MTKVKITESTPTVSVEQQMKQTKLKLGMVFKFTRKLIDSSFKPETFILAVVQTTIGVHNLQLVALDSSNRFSDSMCSSDYSIWQAIEGCSDYTYSDFVVFFVVFSEVEIKLS